MDIDIQSTGISPDPKGNVELVRFGSTAILFCGGDDLDYAVQPTGR